MGQLSGDFALFDRGLGDSGASQVFNYSPSLLSEQTAYATAAATVDLRHYRINSYAIESEKVRPWMGWASRFRGT